VLLCSIGTCPVFLRSLKKGSPLTPSHEMNLLRAAIDPINFCTSWRRSGGAISIITDTISGLGSIPRQETMYSSNFPKGMPNVHFSGFSFILNFLRLSRVSTRLEMIPSSSRVLTTTSSTYASVLRPSSLWRYFCIPLWYVALALFEIE
jgi:hypothetical protein